MDNLRKKYVLLAYINKISDIILKKRLFIFAILNTKLYNASEAKILVDIEICKYDINYIDEKNVTIKICNRTINDFINEKKYNNILPNDLIEGFVDIKIKPNLLLCHKRGIVYLNKQKFDKEHYSKICLIRGNIRYIVEPENASKLLYKKHPSVYSMISIKHNNNINLQKLTYGSNKRIYFYCDECECTIIHKFIAKIKDMSESLTWCNICNNNSPICCKCKSVTHIKYKFIYDDIDQNSENNILFLIKYKQINWNYITATSGAIIDFICKGCPKCGNRHKYPKKINERYSYGCNKCANSCECRFLKNININLFNEIKLSNNLLSQEKINSLTSNSNVKINFQCGVCNNIFKTTVHKRFENYKISIGCGNCIKNGSQMENICKKYLDDKKILYKKEAKFKECLSDLNIHLRYDFHLLINDKKILIELDGRQHFVEVDFFESTLSDNNIRDEIKNKFAKNNKYSLLRISFSEKKNIINHLNDFIYDCIIYDNPIYRNIGKEYKVI